MARMSGGVESSPRRGDARDANGCIVHETGRGGKPARACGVVITSRAALQLYYIVFCDRGGDFIAEGRFRRVVTRLERSEYGSNYAHRMSCRCAHVC